jgi:tRNA-2-methylthio-N6-dimethylallyladenosine synthase
MNVRDTEVIAGLLQNMGYRVAENEEKADIVIFNTCSVRQHAEDKVWSEVGRIAKMPPLDLAQKTHQIKTGGAHCPTGKIIGLVGCMANNYREAIFDRAPGVDFVVGTADIDKIPKILKEVAKLPGHKATREKFFEKKIWETDGEIRPEEIYHTGFHLDKEHAFVVISEGCDNYCSYCVVPYVRGRLRSRAAEDIIREIEEDIACGIKKITLLGQNVNAYVVKSKVRSQKSELQGKSQNSSKEVNFTGLLKIVNQIKGLREFSFVTSHPKDTSIELFKAMAECDKLKKYLHLPVQSGSDRILKLMNRGYTSKFYLDLADNYRKIVKNGALTTDVIVGFPTETEDDFNDSVGLVRKAQFEAGFIFKYSPRPHTQAAGLPDDVPKQEKERRHRLILELQKGISIRKNRKAGENRKNG